MHESSDIEPEDFAGLEEEFIADLARILDVKPTTLEILEISRGCTEIKLRLPLRSVELFELMQKNDPDLPEHLRAEIANFVRKFSVRTTRSGRGISITSRKTKAGRGRARTLTWLHISDVHFEAADTGTKRNHWGQEVVKAHFLRDLPGLLAQEQVEPDIVFLSGDVAFSGDLKEYDLALEFISTLRRVLPMKDVPVVAVPGNHDVARPIVQQYSHEEARALAHLKSNQAIMEYMDSPKHADDRARVFSRLDNFVSFSKRCEQYGQPQLNGYGSFSAIRRINGIDVGIAGMNSAWRCSSNEDRGRVVLGVSQIKQAAEDVQPAHLRLAIVHHPPETDWYVVEDMRYQREAFPEYFDFVLRGHEHDPRVTNSFYEGGQYCTISAGALYSTDEYQKSFNVVHLNPEEQAGWVFFWKLSPGSLKWVKDVELYPTGFHCFKLNQHLAERLTAALDGQEFQPKGEKPGVTKSRRSK